MSDNMKFTRVNGDELSLRFSADGSLSSAFLIVDNVMHDVANQLPALTKEFVNTYVVPLGFRSSWTIQEHMFASRLTEHFTPHGWLVESVTVRPDGNVEFMLTEMKDRNRACESPVARVILEPGKRVNYMVAFAGSQEVAECVESAVRTAFRSV